MAVTGKVTWQPFVLGAGVGLWIAGFDIIYAFMDVKVDREQGLHSIPADFGHGAALWTTRGFHLLAMVLLALLAGAVRRREGPASSTTWAWPSAPCSSSTRTG